MEVSFLPKNFNPIINYEKGIYEFNNIKCKVDKYFSSSVNNKLWLYHLFYFDLLNSDQIEKNKKIKILRVWLNVQNKSKHIEKFDAYPISLRIVNFIKFILKDKYFDDKLISAIFSDTVYLDKIIEYNIDGNHLFTNSKALIFSGVFFNCNKSIYFLDKGFKILKSCLNEQITSEGFHKECSALYQRIILEDLLEIYEILNTSNREYQSIKKYIKEILFKMYIATRSLSFSDNTFCKINDSFNRNDLSKNILLYNKLDNFFNIKGKSQDYFKNWIIINKPDYKLIINAFDNYLNFQPGHIHSSFFAFELEILNQKIFTNRGISTYDDNKKRLLDRSVRSYNIPQIETSNFLDVWKSFRLGKRAKILSKKIIQKKDYLIINLEHDGYLNQYGLIQSRKYICKKNVIEIYDEFIGKNKLKFKKQINYFINKKFNINQIDNYNFDIYNHNVLVNVNISEYTNIKKTIMYEEMNKFIKSSKLNTFFKNSKIVTKISW